MIFIISNLILTVYVLKVLCNSNHKKINNFEKYK